MSNLLPMMMRPVALQPLHFAREPIPESSFSLCLPTIHHPMYDHDSNEMRNGGKVANALQEMLLFLFFYILLIQDYKW